MFFSILGCALYIVNNESKPLWALPCFIKKILKKTLKKHPKNDLKTGYFGGKNWDKNLIEKKRLPESLKLRKRAKMGPKMGPKTLSREARCDFRRPPWKPFGPRGLPEAPPEAQGAQK